MTFYSGIKEIILLITAFSFLVPGNYPLAWETLGC